jgi:uncharacterized protein (UPF0297 family)
MRVPIIERAFQLADQGLVLRDVKKALKAEGYAAIGQQLVGRTLLASLAKRARAAKSGAGQE